MSKPYADWWYEVSPYLDQGLEMEEEARAAWLDSLREKDRVLAERLHMLLDEHRALAAAGFLESSALPLQGQAANAGQTLGAYRLVSPIGQGGMGSVWLAERNDGHFERRVAVKFLGIALAGREDEERFKREGSILGRLAHPHIAELLDAGLSPRGEPYLILEYVDGERIDQYCDKRIPDVNTRVRLFLDVLAAVAHAHANLVVHRDIKPSNVLVRGDGQVKLVDFGIAKLLEDEEQSTAATLRTRGGLTPAFAAPEQVTGGAITTATDIYALGVLLFVLLTGQHPSGPGPQSLADLIKTIVETEPPRPSEAVTVPDKFRRAIRGDLDTIVAKALKKDPRERYSSVTALADDLERYLRHEPIGARPDTLAYRTAKFARRNRPAVSLAALALMALLAGVLGTVIQARTAERERAIAQRRFNEVRQLSNKLFDIDAQARQLPGSTKTRQLIVDTSLEYLRRLSSDVRGDPELALELGHAYMQVARVQGVSTGRNLGQTAQAEQNLRAADGLIQSVLASQPANRTALLRAAQVSHDRMILAAGQGGRRDAANHPEALAFARTSAESLDKFNAGKKDKPEDVEEALSIYMDVADLQMQARQFDDALRLCSRASELARSLDNTQALAMFRWVTAEVLQQRADLDESLNAIRESVKLLDVGAGDTGVSQLMSLVHVLTWQGRILGQYNGVSLGRGEEAVASLDRAFQLTDDVVHQDAHDQNSRARLALAGNAMADILRHKDTGRALTVYDHTLRHLAEIHDDSVIGRLEVEALAGSSYALRRLGRPAEARERLDAAFERLKQLKMYPAEKITPGSVAFKTVRALADFEADNGDVPHAIETYEKLLEQIRAGKLAPDVLLEDALDLSNIYLALSDLHRRAGEAAAASDVEAHRLELWRQWERKLPENPFVLRQIAATTGNARVPR